MASALEEFRAQREAVAEVLARLTEVADLLRALQQQTATLAQNEPLRKLLQEEQTWLARAQDLVNHVRQFRERETDQFWPAVWRRWAAVMGLAVVTAVGAGAGYVWAARPYAAELASLRSRVKLLDGMARRVIAMTPAERRQFDALMKLDGGAKP